VAEYKKKSAYKKNQPKDGRTAISPPSNSPEQYQKEKDSPDELYAKFSKEIESARDYAGTWTQKQDVWHRLRMRIRKEKSFPFIGSSNLRMPTIEKYIVKNKSALLSLIWGQTPKCLVRAGMTGNPDTAFKLEHYLDWLAESKIKALRKLAILEDKVEEKGFGLMEVIWRMESEKRTFEIDMTILPPELQMLIFQVGQPELDEQLYELLAKLFDVDLSETVRQDNLTAIAKAIEAFRKGEKKTKVTIHDETYNNVDWNIVDPEMCYVPVDSQIDPQNARWIAVEYYESFEVVKKKAADGLYDAKVVGEIDGERFKNMDKSNPITNMTQTAITKDLREGIAMLNNPSHSVKIWRMYAWHDIDGDGIDERCVLILCPSFHKVLAKFPLPYHHKKWPIVRFDSEWIDDRWYSSRGIPERLEDIAKEIDTQHNQKIDQQTIRNAPMFTFRSGVVNPKLVKFIPGQAIPVPGTLPLKDAVDIMRNESTNVEFSYRDEEMMLKAEAQELLGTPDYSMQSLINRRQPRTAQEVGAQQQSAQTVFSLYAMMWAYSLSEVFNQSLQLTQQYLPQEVWFTVTGDNQAIRLSRDEIQGEYLSKVRANDLAVNASQRVQLVEKMTMYLSQPMFTGTGIVGPENIFQIGKRFLQGIGEFGWQGILTPPQNIPPKGPPPPITQIKVNSADLSPKELSQVLASGGIEPDLEAHVMDKQLEVMKEMENEKRESATRS